jgi:hypothetical protein
MPRRVVIKPPNKASIFVNCMNECGKRIELTEAMQQRFLISRNPIIVDPTVHITCCECAFGLTSEQLLQEN